MNLEYWKVTSVIRKDNKISYNVLSNITDKEYQECDIISMKWFTSLPKEGDVVLLNRIHNAEVCILGVLNNKYLDDNRILFEKDWAFIEFLDDWMIRIQTWSSKIELNKTWVINITATTLNII